MLLLYHVPRRCQQEIRGFFDLCDFALVFPAPSGILESRNICEKGGVFMKRLSENDHIDFYRHLAFCTVGGFFGAYAVLVHSGVMGNAQTMNLLEMVIDLLRWQLPDMLLHLGALALYVLGTMLTVLLPHWCGADMHRLSPIVTAVAAVVVALLPPELDPVVALYPVFAMSIQWSSFAGARGFLQFHHLLPITPSSPRWRWRSTCATTTGRTCGKCGSIWPRWVASTSARRGRSAR